VRIKALSLHAFGAVAERTLDLSAQAPALHLVYGANEAGKSTTLRALTALLYGVPSQTGDGSVFGYANMRIGATLTDATGRELSIVRRKGSKNTLAAPDGTLLDESVLSALLQGIPEPAFRNMFGLDHDSLRQGGEQLRQGKGDLGESLFQAASGGPSIRNALASLEQEADRLWKPRGKQEIRHAIDRYNDVRARFRAATKGAEAVRSQQRALDELRAQVSELGARQRALRAEHGAATRAAHLLPLLLQRRELEAQRAALGEAALLPSDAPAQRRQAQQALALAEADIARLRALVDDRRAQRAAFDIPESLLALPAERSARIGQELGKHMKAARDLPRVRAEMQLAAREVERSLGGLTLEQAGEMTLDAAAVAAVQQRAVEYSGLRGRVDDAAIALRAAEARLSDERQALRALMSSREADVAIASARLPHPELVSGLRQRFEALRATAAKDEQRARELEEADERARQDIDTMQREGAPPTEQELQNARAGRDAKLRELQASLGPEQRAFEFGGEASKDASKSNARAELRVKALDHAREAASALEREQTKSDELADRLRREAARVSELARLFSLRDRLARDRERFQAARAEQVTQEQVLAQEWRALWAPLGIAPKEPAAMQAWLLQVSARLETAERQREAADIKLKEAQEALARFEEDWARRMQRLQLAPDTAVADALDQLGERRRMFEKIEALKKLRGRVEGMERDARAFEDEVRPLVKAHLPALADVELERAADELVRAHNNAREALGERAAIDRELRVRQDELSAAEARANAARAGLGEQLEAARATDIQGLLLAEELSEKARELDRKLSEVQDRLREASEGEDLEQLGTQLGAESVDRLRARKAEVADELESVQDEHAARVRELAATEAGLLNLQGDEAASCAVDVEQQLEAVSELTRRYVRTRLAADVLQLVVRRYREENQAPMVRDGSALFARLTLGRYARLDVRYDDRDEPALVAVDAENRVVQIESLSDGTRDQLYLALRLSSLQRFAERAEPLPLVLDDVLVQFDDARAAAALAVLSETAALTQVVFFTHHARLVDLARKAVPEQCLVVHELDQSSTRKPTLGSTMAG
jgi:uncharacterized protein YhaN